MTTVYSESFKEQALAKVYRRGDRNRRDRRPGRLLLYRQGTFFGSLACLRPLGLLVSFGNASGPVPPFDILELSKRGSLFLTRPTLSSYTAKRSELLQMAREPFEMVTSGQVRIEINRTYALQDAAQAHVDLAARKTTGSTILDPHPIKVQEPQP